MFSTDKKNNKQVQNYIKLNELGYVTKNEKHYDFTEHLLPIVFSIYMYIFNIYIYIYIFYMKEFYQNKMVLKNKRNYSVN